MADRVEENLKGIKPTISSKRSRQKFGSKISVPKSQNQPEQSRNPLHSSSEPAQPAQISVQTKVEFTPRTYDNAQPDFFIPPASNLMPVSHGMNPTGGGVPYQDPYFEGFMTPFDLNTTTSLSTVPSNVATQLGFESSYNQPEYSLVDSSFFANHGYPVVDYGFNLDTDNLLLREPPIFNRYDISNLSNAHIGAGIATEQLYEDSSYGIMGLDTPASIPVPSDAEIDAMLVTTMAPLADLLPTIISQDSILGNFASPPIIDEVGTTPQTQAGYLGPTPPSAASELFTSDLDSLPNLRWDSSSQISATSAIPNTTPEPQTQSVVHIQQNNRYIQLPSQDFDTFVHSANLLAQYARQTVIQRQAQDKLIYPPHSSETIPSELVYAQEIGSEGFPIQFEHPATYEQGPKRHKRRAFDEDGRKKVKQVRQMRACVRCRMNKRSCSTEEHCKGCVSLVKRIGANPTILKDLCFRHSLFDLRFNQTESGMPTWEQYQIHGKHIEEAFAALKNNALKLQSDLRESVFKGEMTDEAIDGLNAIVPGHITATLQKGKRHPAYLEHWQRTCLQVLQNKKRDVPTTLTTDEFFHLIGKLQYAQSMEETEQLELQLAETLVTFFTIFFAVKYNACSPHTVLPPGHSMESYCTAIDFMEGLLMKETDRMLNRIGQYPKKKIDGLLAVLDVWELRFTFSVIWRAAISKLDLSGFNPVDLEALKGIEVSINGLRTAMIRRS